MVQNIKSEPSRRGRPRAYDPQIALRRALEAFWSKGYSGTSLDDLAAATGMNRPSLYAAFGDKHALYLKALAHYWDVSLRTMQEALLDKNMSLDDALMRIYDEQLSLYFSGDGRPRGCFAIGTATTEAVGDPEIRRSLADGLRTLDADFATRLHLAQDSGALDDDADIATLATIASATLQTIAIRARAGVPRATLRDLAFKVVTLICR